ncbi:MAG: DUF1697 domain-containing protein [Ignavibacteriales bacterium]|nr:DUF1697 domain-containing protein [Ignavibacteriales bacterium]
MPTYVALLRGINSGKNPATKMDVLKKSFEDLGFKNVKTVIASGNVIFESTISDTTKLERKIEKGIAPVIKFHSDTIVRTIEEIRSFVKKNPFKKIKVTPETRLYVTFINDEQKSPLKFPVQGKGYTMLGIFDRAVCIVIYLAETKTPDVMKVLDKNWSPNTTRNWNTLERILKAAK